MMQCACSCCSNQAKASWTGVMPMSKGKGFLRVVTTAGAGTAAIPNKTISMELLSWHDPLSAGYMSDCISCHGTLTGELALDGAHLMAHSTMLGDFGSGNSRCILCHEDNPGNLGNYCLTYAAGSLSEQVNVQTKDCTDCQDKGGGETEYYDL